MTGVVELAEEVFHMPVRLGMPQYGITGLSDVVRNPIHATGVGLLMFGCEKQLDGGVRRGGLGTEPKALIQRMKEWFQNNF